MKYLFILFILVSPVIGGTNSLDAIYKEIVTLFRAKQYQKAIPKTKLALKKAEQIYGKYSTNSTVYLNLIGTLYCLEHRYSEAEPYYLQSVEIRKKVYTTNHIAVAQSLNNLAALYVKQNKYSEAENPFQQALAIYTNVFSSNNLNVATCYNNLGELCRYQGKYKKAEQYHRQALEIRKNTLSHTDKLVAQSFNNFGEILRIQNKYSKAEKMFQNGLSAAELNPNTRIKTTLLCNLAFLYREQGEYSKADSLYNEAYKLRSKIFGDSNIRSSAILNDLAILYQDMGNYLKAKKTYLKVLNIYTNVLGKSHSRVATVEKNLAGVCSDLGSYAEAEKHYINALKIREKISGTNHVDVASALNDIGSFFRLQDKYNEAEPLYKRALSIRQNKLGMKHLDTAGSLNNLARLYKDLKRYSEAANNYNQALKIMFDIHGTNHPDSAKTMNNLAEVYRACGKYKDALPLYSKALKSFVIFFGTNHPAVADVFYNQAQAYHSMTNYSYAEKLYLKALKIQKNVLGKNHWQTANTLAKLGKLYFARKEELRAAEYFAKAMTAYESSAKLAGNETYSNKFRRKQREVCSEYLEVLFATKNLSNVDIAEKSFQAMETSRARRFLDQILSASASRYAGLSAEDGKAEEKILLTMRALNKEKRENLLKKGNQENNFSLSRIEIKLGEVRTKYQKLIEEFAKKYPRFIDLRTAKSINIKELQNKVLKKNELFISYWLASDHLFACVIGEKSMRFLAHPVNRSEFRDRVRNFRTLLATYIPLSECKTYKKVAFSLYEDIIKPFVTESELSDIEVMYIVPNDVLCTIPFESLVTTESGNNFSDLDYFFLKTSTAYVPSARVLRAIRNEKLSATISTEKNKSAILFGDPIYYGVTPHGNKNETLHLTMDELTLIVPLPSTREEIEVISDILQKNNYSVLSCLGNKAKESFLKSINVSGMLANNQYIHFATHTILPGQISTLTEPCLVLSIYGDEHEDGFLKMSEILELKINADMVTLSACRAGAVSEKEFSEGISGLARAFFYAGTPSVTAALWDVEDKSAMRFMKVFYEKFNKKSAINALNDAKVSLLKSKKFNHPAFWSGFVLLGEWE